jgi:hypothetical protein
MKRLGLVAMRLLASALSAHADNDVYNNITRHPRGDDALQLDTGACSQMLGVPQNGIPTSKAYKSCMVTRGWRFSHAVRERSTAGAHVSRSGQPGPDVQGFRDRRYDPIELLEFLKCAWKHHGKRRAACGTKSPASGSIRAAGRVKIRFDRGTTRTRRVRWRRQGRRRDTR